MNPVIRPTDALIIVDVQNDFCEGGVFDLKGGNAIVAPINALVSDSGAHAGFSPRRAFIFCVEPPWFRGPVDDRHALWATGVMA